MSCYVEKVVAIAWRQLTDQSQLTDVQQACREVCETIPVEFAVTACEPTINRTLIQQLKVSGIFDGFEIVDNEQREGEHHYSEYDLSREDFGIHPLNFNMEENSGWKCSDLFQ